MALNPVVLESPYAGNVESNVAYARRCVVDSLSRGEAPIASHLLYTQPGILDDNDPEQRKLGREAGLAWLESAGMMVVYADRGISPGMHEAMLEAAAEGLPVEVRYIEKKP
jgi:hypothetical protein